MYTERIVTGRFCAFLLALVLGLTPIAGVVCGTVCAAPVTPAACHEAAPDDGAELQAAGGACEHSDGGPAVLAGIPRATGPAGLNSLAATAPVVSPAEVAAAADVLHPPVSSRSLPVRSISVLRL